MEKTIKATNELLECIGRSDTFLTSELNEICITKNKVHYLPSKVQLKEGKIVLDVLHVSSARLYEWNISFAKLSLIYISLLEFCYSHKIYM